MGDLTEDQDIGALGREDVEDTLTKLLERE